MDITNHINIFYWINVLTEMVNDPHVLEDLVLIKKLLLAHTNPILKSYFNSLNSIPNSIDKLDSHDLLSLLDKLSITLDKLEQLERNNKENIKNIHEMIVLHNKTIGECVKYVHDKKNSFGFNIHSSFKNNQESALMEIKQWTNLSTCNLIYDSCKDGWSGVVFNYSLLHQNNIFISVQLPDNSLLGFYIYSTINTIGNWINDPNHFLVYSNNNKPFKLTRKQSLHSNKSISLCKQPSQYMFYYIYLCGIQSTARNVSYIDNQALTNFNLPDVAIIFGKHFSIPRLFVYQFTSPNQIKN
ncbi:hypothetical protein QTN25_010528 [Entamoeba marina]